jgi:uncharacterized protein (UPF0303 family)
MDMAGESEIGRIAEQEARLQFRTFDTQTAWILGSWIRDVALQRGLRIAFEVHANGMTVFQHAMAGTTPDNADWIRRKRNLVLRMHASSLAYHFKQQVWGMGIDERLGLSLQDFAASGGGFPIRVAGAGFIGALVVSGLTGRQDHDLAVEAIASALDIPFTEVGLD